MIEEEFGLEPGEADRLLANPRQARSDGSRPDG
jgi:hypothetical protein